MKILRSILVCAFAVVSASAAHGEVAGALRGSVEELRYSWRLRGAVRYLAGLFLPTSGHGQLRTTYGPTIHSELLLTAPNGREGGFYEYESQIDQEGAKTLMTYHAYEWRERSRQDRTVIDYVKRLARIRRETRGVVRDRVKQLPDGELRDVLTAVYVLRQDPAAWDEPRQTTIYSDGKEYPVVLRGGEERQFEIAGRRVVARAFHIADAPGGRRFPGDVTVWLTTDAEHLPVRIEVAKSVASVQLDLREVVVRR
jgi:hypothetical protein